MEYQIENFDGRYDFRSRRHFGWKMRANLHEYSELLFCKSGSGQVIINGATIFLQKDQMVWIPPNYIHEYDFDDAELICAVFSNDYIPLFFEELGNRYFCVSAVNITKTPHLIDALPSLCGGSRLCICGYLNSICSEMMEQARFEASRHGDGVLYQKVIGYISENYTQGIRLTQVAKEFGYNTKYLSHTLHELTGVHFNHLVNFYRVNHAKRLLEQNKDWSIATIAAESGFEAVNTFNREFKRLTGLTPMEYKRPFN